ACNKITTLNQKKYINSEYVVFEFRTKKILFVDISYNIIDKIYKFPFLIQQMLVTEACAVEKRIKKGKVASELTSFNYSSVFQEYGFEVYFHCEIVEMDISEKTEAEKAANNQKSAI
ncbi:8017_t:CDS:2, partial [Scutellospora calospora]